MTPTQNDTAQSTADQQNAAALFSDAELDRVAGGGGVEAWELPDMDSEHLHEAGGRPRNKLAVTGNNPKAFNMADGQLDAIAGGLFRGCIPTDPCQRTLTIQRLGTNSPRQIPRGGFRRQELGISCGKGCNET